MSEGREDFTADKADELIQRLDDLSTELDRHRAVVEQARHRSKVAQTLAVITCGLAVAVGFLAVGVWVAVGDINQTRTEARYTTCVNHNVDFKIIREALRQSILTFADDPDSLTAEEQAALDGYVAALTAGMEYRDCSKSGIDFYYANPPADPALTEPGVNNP